MEDLTELRDRILMLPTLESRMAALNGAISRAETEAAAWLGQYRQEQRDVEQMEKESLSVFLLRVIGKYDDKLEKERREEIEAKLAYDKAITRRDSLAAEKAELAARIAVLKEEERAYQGELALRRQKLKASPPYARLENQRREIVSQISEIQQALRAAARAKATANTALDSLKSAEGWATYDAFTRGGIISHMAKYSHIDSAEANFHALASQVQDLNAELSDINGLTTDGLGEISSASRTIDFWFDNIFTDLSVRGKIKDNANEVNRLIRSISNVEAALHSRLRAEEAKLEGNHRREEELLLSTEG